MKLSMYNFFRKFDNNIIFFNSRTCALAIVNDKFMQIVDDIQNDNFNESSYDSVLIQNMRRSGCIIDDSTDELTELEFRRNYSKYRADFLGLTITPTLNCNFRCQYCFEEHKVGNMDQHTQDALIQFISKRVQSIKKLSITWFGGEPLLCKDMIYGLSEKILCLCNRHNVDYISFMVTNASLISDSDIILFKKYHIKNVQVTIDGPKEVHDQRRKTCSGKSSFDMIIKNVNKLLDGNIGVSVRINIDKTNIDCVDLLLRHLKEQIDRYKELLIGFGKISVFTDVCRSIEIDCLDNENYSNARLALYGKALEYGFEKCKMLAYPKLKYNNCCADYANSYVVDVSGSLYKCWNQVGRLNEKCGDVFHGCDIKSTNFLRWVQWSPFQFDKCKNCSLLPICMGGCPYMMNANSNREPVCDSIRYNLDSMLGFYYNYLKVAR